MRKSKYDKIAENLEGRWTLESLSRNLGVTRNKAIYIIYRLRKKGYIRTYYGRDKMRVYYISIANLSQKKSYTEKINEVSPIKLAEWSPYYIHGREPSYEEVLVYALKKRDVRYTIAAIALFRKISDWTLLYKLAKKENMLPEVAALYDVARLFLKRLQRMPIRFSNLAMKRKNKFKYVVPRSSSKDFKEIERKWRVYIPLNRSDLAEYRGIAA